MQLVLLVKKLEFSIYSQGFPVSAGSPYLHISAIEVHKVHWLGSLH